MDSWNEKEVMALALQAGQILLKNGAEIFRVEETMERICHRYGVISEDEFVLSNGIFLTGGSGQEQSFARVRHIPMGRTHLGKVAAVNQLSRKIEEENYTVKEAAELLERIDREPETGKVLLVLASGIGSAAFCLLFGGNVADSLVVLTAGSLLYAFILYLAESHISKIAGNILGSALATIFCGVVQLLGIGIHLNFMVIGSVMPLIPGVAFMNAVREIADGDYISGLVRMLDALLGFFCIAIGVGIGILLLHCIGGGGFL